MTVKAIDRITRLVIVIDGSRNGLTNSVAKTLSLPKSILSTVLNSLTRNERLALDTVSERYRRGAVVCQP